MAKIRMLKGSKYFTLCNVSVTLCESGTYVRGLFTPTEQTITKEMQFDRTWLFVRKGTIFSLNEFC